MTTNEALNAYIKGLPVRERMAKVRDICEYCMVTPAVVKFWRLGLTRIREVYIGKITEVLGEDIFAGVEK